MKVIRFLIFLFSSFIITNPFYFMEDIVYGNNNHKDKFGIYNIRFGPDISQDWNIKIKSIFDTKIENLEEWPRSIKNYISILDDANPIIAIKKKNLKSFKRQIDRIVKRDDWFKQFKFLYIDAIKVSGYNSFVGHYFIIVADSNPIIDRSHISNVYVEVDTLDAISVGLEMNKVGTNLYREYTSNNINTFAAIAVESQIYSIYFINQRINNGKAIISGFDSFDEAKYVKNYFK